MPLAKTPAPTAPVPPWVWLIAAAFAITCLVCPCGIGAGWWLVGGWGSMPTEEMARKVVEKRSKRDLATGYVRLLSVRKTDATTMVEKGQEFAIIHCDVEYEFLKNWKKNAPAAPDWNDDDPLGKVKIKLKVNDPPDPDLGLLHWPNRGKEEYRKGEKLVIKTKVLFQKSEKGWRDPLITVISKEI